MSEDTAVGNLELQKRFFESGVTRSIQSRIDALRKLQSSIKKYEPQILEALKRDMNKPNIEAFLSEVFFLDQEINLVCKKLKKWLKPKKASNPIYFWPAKSWVTLEPYGNTLILGPWNYPIQLSLAPIIAAVAAGNTAILKPSELTPQCELILTKIIAECFDPNWVQCVTGGAETSVNLLAQDFNFVFFTGSSAVGKKVHHQLAGRLIPCVMELGGKCPCVVESYKDITEVAGRIIAGKFFNGGQTCFAPDFIAVKQHLKDALVTELKNTLEIRYKEDTENQLSGNISANHNQRLHSLIEGDSFKIGKDDDQFFAPRILTDANWQSKAMSEEVFGALLPVVSYTDDAELLTELKKYSSPLALYLFSNNNDWIEIMTSNLQSGSVCINDTMKQSSNLNLPFGGIGDSGFGRYRGRWGIEQFSYLRSFTKRYFIKDVFAIVPPYAGAIEKMKKLLRW